MTTHFRTLLLLGFTALAASASGCIIETTSDNGAGNCSAQRYFQVYWSATQADVPLTCGETPASKVQLTTSTGVYAVGIQCHLTSYMGSTFDFAGSTVDGIPAGSYVTRADLIDSSNTSISGLQVPYDPLNAMPSCDRVELGYYFGL